MGSVHRAVGGDHARVEVAPREDCVPPQAGGLRELSVARGRGEATFRGYAFDGI